MSQAKPTETKIERLRMIAGTPADREALKAARDAAREAHAKHGPRIGDRIVELSKQLRGLERDERLTAKRYNEATDAARELENL